MRIEIYEEEKGVGREWWNGLLFFCSGISECCGSACIGALPRMSGAERGRDCGEGMEERSDTAPREGANIGAGGRGGVLLLTARHARHANAYSVQRKPTEIHLLARGYF